MQNFVQYAPTEVIFGKDTEKETGAEVKKWGGSRVLLVYGGGSAVRSGLIGRVEESLKKRGDCVRRVWRSQAESPSCFCGRRGPEGDCLRGGFYPGSGRRKRH